MDHSPPESSIHGILQARILEWVAMVSSRASSPPRDRTQVSYVSCIGSWVLYYQCHLGSPVVLMQYKVGMSLEYSVLLLQATRVWFLVGGLICLQFRRPRFDTPVRKVPWRRKWLPPPVFLLSAKILVFLAWRIPWTEEPGDYNQGSFKESDATEQLTYTVVLRSICCMKSENEVTQSCLTLRLRGLSPTRLLYPWGFPGKNSGVGCHLLLQGIFHTQGLNPGLPHCRQMLYPLSHKGSPICCMVRLKKREKNKVGNFHVVQCESSALSLPRALVQSLVGKLRSCKLCGWPKKEKREKDRSGSSGMDSGPWYVVCDKKSQHKLEHGMLFL